MRTVFRGYLSTPGEVSSAPGTPVVQRTEIADDRLRVLNLQLRTASYAWKVHGRAQFLKKHALRGRRHSTPRKFPSSGLVSSGPEQDIPLSLVEAKQLLRSICPMKQTELDYFMGILTSGVKLSSLSLKTFDAFLYKLAEHAAGGTPKTPGKRRARRRGRRKLDLANVETGTDGTSSVLIRSGKHTAVVEDLLQRMQRQVQRSLLFNPPLFASLNMPTAPLDSEKGKLKRKSPQRKKLLLAFHTSPFLCAHPRSQQWRLSRTSSLDGRASHLHAAPACGADIRAQLPRAPTHELRRTLCRPA